MSRILDLIQKTLWECTECGRLEYSVEQPMCEKCRVLYMHSIDRHPTTEFEAIGQHFYRDTGYVRPGKDCRKHDIAERQAAFDKWNKGEPERWGESIANVAQDGNRFRYLKQCTNGGHFNEERQELVWTFHIPAKRMHGSITAAVDHARFDGEVSDDAETRRLRGEGRIPTEFI